MSAVALSSLPDRIVAGSSVVYTATAAGYRPADGWAFELQLAGAVVVQVQGVASGDGWTVTLSPTVTLGLVAGTYQFREVASKGSTLSEVVREGRIVVAKSLRAVTAGEAQTWAEGALEDLEAAYRQFLATGAAEMTIDGRTVKYQTEAQFASARARLKREIARAGRKSAFGQVLFTTGTPGGAS